MSDSKGNILSRITFTRFLSKFNVKNKYLFILDKCSLFVEDSLLEAKKKLWQTVLMIDDEAVLFMIHQMLDAALEQQALEEQTTTTPTTPSFEKDKETQN